MPLATDWPRGRKISYWLTGRHVQYICLFLNNQSDRQITAWKNDSVSNRGVATGVYRYIYPQISLPQFFYVVVLSPWPIYTHPNQIPGYASGLELSGSTLFSRSFILGRHHMIISVAKLFCHADERFLTRSLFEETSRAKVAVKSQRKCFDHPRIPIATCLGRSCSNCISAVTVWYDFGAGWNNTHSCMQNDLVLRFLTLFFRTLFSRSFIFSRLRMTITIVKLFGDADKLFEKKNCSSVIDYETSYGTQINNAIWYRVYMLKH